MTISENHQSRGGGKSVTGGQRTLKYDVLATGDDQSVQTQIEATIPAIYDGCFFESYDYDPEEGGDLWRVTVRYTARPPAGPNSPTGPGFTFDIGGGTQHITQSLQTVGAYPAAGIPAAPDFAGAIGADGEQVAGCDIYFPVYNFTETHYLHPDLVTPAYKAALFHLTKHPMNAAPFKGFARGEVLFLGARGSLRTGEDWEITYSFSASQNASNLILGPITVQEKLGWDYLWIYYAEVKDDAAQRVVQRPIAAYVERVYGFGDFSTLGI